MAEGGADGTYVIPPLELSPLNRDLLFIIPICVVVLSAIIFYFWPEVQVKQPKKSTDVEMNGSAKENTVLLPGDERSDYKHINWMQSFDGLFLAFMLVLFAVLLVWTHYSKPELFGNKTFWIYQIPKIVIMMGVSICAGLFCRLFMPMTAEGYLVNPRDENGKVKKHPWFKVNYTRKIQHFLAYLIPLVFKVPPSCNCSGLLETIWGQAFTLAVWVLMIKPIRERIPPIMMMFNALDRPEDRPYNLKWIIGANIIPGTIMISFFRFLYHPTGQQELTLIFVYVTGLGDGFAEPVGIWLGRHAYAARSCDSAIKYIRTYEGSLCVFLSGMIFTATTWYAFANTTQLWICFFVMAPAMAIAEATSPHTMDTPALMGFGGLIIYIIIRCF